MEKTRKAFWFSSNHQEINKKSTASYFCTTIPDSVHKYSNRTYFKTLCLALFPFHKSFYSLECAILFLLPRKFWSFCLPNLVLLGFSSLIILLLLLLSDRELSDSHQAFDMQLTGSCQVAVRQLSGSCQTDVKQL